MLLTCWLYRMLVLSLRVSDAFDSGITLRPRILAHRMTMREGSTIPEIASRRVAIAAPCVIAPHQVLLPAHIGRRVTTLPRRH
jgi:hypothetical protein